MDYMMTDYFSFDDSAYAAYQAELELQEWFESEAFAIWFNDAVKEAIAIEEIVVPTEVFNGVVYV